LLQPFIYLLYGYTNSDFFGGNKRKISISLPFHQVEGIASNNGLKFYISNENFVKSPFVNNPQKLHILDLSPFLNIYLNSLKVKVPETKVKKNFDIISPNPASDFIEISVGANGRSPLQIEIRIYDVFGQRVNLTPTLFILDEGVRIDVSGLAPGMYFVRVGENIGKFVKL
jgi:hypothetical protein